MATSSDLVLRVRREVEDLYNLVVSFTISVVHANCTVATLTISATQFIVSTTNTGSDPEDLLLDLTSGAYDTLGELRSHIATLTGYVIDDAPELEESFPTSNLRLRTAVNILNNPTPVERKQLFADAVYEQALMDSVAVIDPNATTALSDRITALVVGREHILVWLASSIMCERRGYRELSLAETESDTVMTIGSLLSLDDPNRLDIAKTWFDRSDAFLKRYSDSGGPPIIEGELQRDYVTDREKREGFGTYSPTSWELGSSS